MKKSKKLCLVLMGAMALAGCGGGSSNEPTVFRTKAECVASGEFNEEQCSRMEAEALAQTPKFANREECVKQFGEDACKQQVNNSGDSIWMPMLMGFMAGRLLGGGSFAPAQGLYNNPANNGAYQTARGAPVGSAVSRGGFSTGSRAVSRGGFSTGGRAVGA